MVNPLRLAFNATSLLSPLTGVGQYSKQLALGLAAHPEVDVDFFYGAMWSRDVRDTPLKVASRMFPWLRAHVPYAYELRRFIQRQQFARKERTFDLYHEPNYLTLPLAVPKVITVHDLSWIRYPEMHPIERVNAMDKYFKPSLDGATLVITDSEFVKRELIEVCGVAPERIRPVALGVEALFQPLSPAQTKPVLEANGLVHGQYLLGVGTLEPRKNLSLALRAFMGLAPALRKRYPLVLVGMKGWHTSALELEIAPLVAAGEIRLLGYLPREALATVIAGATTLIYPSVYEGFGLPPLEAMACGVPVIASNVSSLPEVVGDTGLMIDPKDVDGLKDAIERLLVNPELRAELSARALARSASFTWQRCVDQTVNVYREALSRS